MSTAVQRETKPPRYTSGVGLADIERALSTVLERHDDVLAAWLFGSLARGMERADSDVDVAVLLGRRMRPRTLDDLPLDLEAELGSAIGRPVQVVVMDHAPVDLVHRVLRDGRLLVERDKAARIGFEVDARNRFFDMQPIWREYRRRA